MTEQAEHPKYWAGDPQHGGDTTNQGGDTTNQSGDTTQTGGTTDQGGATNPAGFTTDQVGDTLNSLSTPGQDPVIATENQAILSFHDALEDIGHETSLTGTIHGLTNDGETIGLGKVGENNLITDAAQTPGDLLNGASAGMEASNLITDVGNSVSATGGFIQGIGSDTSNPNLVSDVVNGLANSANGGALGDLGGVGDLGGLGNLGGLGDLGGIGNPLGGNGNGGGSAISVGAGNSGDIPILGDSPILNAGVLNQPSGNSPIEVVAGNGQSLADVGVLNGNTGGNGHLVSADAGASGDSHLLDSGVLTTSDSTAPVGADVGNGSNIADASLLSQSNALQFPDLGGAGSDSLTGIIPTNVGLADLGDLSGATSGSNEGPSLVDAHTDGSGLVQTHDEPTSLVGLNSHAIV